MSFAARAVAAALLTALLSSSNAMWTIALSPDSDTIQETDPASAASSLADSSEPGPTPPPTLDPPAAAATTEAGEPGETKEPDGHPDRPKKTDEPDPTPPPAPDPTSEPDSTSERDRPTTSYLFSADAESAGQWCFVHSAVPVDRVRGPVHSGDYAYKAEVRDGYTIYDTERSTWSNGPGDCEDYRYAPGDTTTTSFSIYLAPDFPTYSSWALVAQWKEPQGGTPPQQLSVRGGRWSIVGSADLSSRPKWDLGPIERGVWTNFEITHTWGASGSVEVSMNGTRVLAETSTRTMDSTNPLFLAIGHYRDTANSGTAILYFDDVTIH